MPEKGWPQCPEWLSEEAVVVWERVAATLDGMGVLTVADGEILARYADMWVWHRQCREFVEENGAFCTAPMGPKDHPEARRAERLAQQLLRMEAEMGLTPSGRTRIRVGSAEKGKGKTGKFKVAG